MECCAGVGTWRKLRASQRGSRLALTASWTLRAPGRSRCAALQPSFSPPCSSFRWPRPPPRPIRPGRSPSRVRPWTRRRRRSPPSSRHRPSRRSHRRPPIRRLPRPHRHPRHPNQRHLLRPPIPRRPQRIPTRSNSTQRVGPIATGRYIVVLDSTADTTKVMTRHRQREGIAGRPFVQERVPRLHGEARCHAAQARSSPIRASPPSSPMRSSRSPPRPSRPACRASGPGSRPSPRSTGSTNGSMPTSPSSTPASPPIRTSSSPAATTARSSDRTRWRDENGHGTHVAGTVGARDNTIGVVGVAPGVRLWAVRILNSSGYGLLSWYVCGLDWILAQKDPNDRSRPLIEAVNMSVAKTGSDDANCGAARQGHPAQGDLPALRRRHHGRRRGGQRADERRELRSGRLQPGHHGLGPRRHGRRAGGTGGQPLLLVGRLRLRRHVRRLQQLRLGHRPHRPGQVHLVDQARADIRVLVRHVHGRATRHRCGRAVQVEQARATPAEVRESLRYLGNLGWKTYTDPGSVPRAAARRESDREPRHVLAVARVAVDRLVAWRQRSTRHSP